MVNPTAQTPSIEEVLDMLEALPAGFFEYFEIA